MALTGGQTQLLLSLQSWAKTSTKTKNVQKKGMEQHPIPLEFPVSKKQPSLISSTCKIQKSKKNAMYTQVHSADLFFLHF